MTCRNTVFAKQTLRWSLLRWAAVLYGLGTLLHTLDHLRRGTDAVTSQVLWAGSLSTPVVIVVIFLAVVGFRYAPILAVAVGLPHAVGITAVHLAPHWGVLSDSLTSNGASGITYAAVLVEIIGALAFAAAGAYILLAERKIANPHPTLLHGN